MDNPWRPTRLYHLDENLNVAGSEPLGSLNELVVFCSDRSCRVYPTPREDEHAPSVEVYVNATGLPTVVLDFCPEATPDELRNLWQFLRRKSTSDALAARLGSIRVAWGGPIKRPQPIENTLTVYFSGSSGWAFLTLVPIYKTTYRDLLADYKYLRKLLEESQGEQLSRMFQRGPRR